MSERQLTACISGSFKFKPEIDALHEEFADYGVTVLEPTKGWLYVPGSPELSVPDIFRPLPSERGLDPGQVEGRFLSAVRKADFMYLFNQYHYIGASVAAEIGYAYGSRIPTFALNPLTIANFDYEIDSWKKWSKRVIVAQPKAAAESTRLIKGFMDKWSSKLK